MALTVAFLVAGLVLLFVGGEGLVRGSVALASKLGISPLVIGLTVVGFGTSTPELLVSLSAAFKGAPDIAVGNVVGSNIANILLILGVSALITPLAIKYSNLARDLYVMLIASAGLALLAYIGEANRVSGFILLVSLIGYVIYAIRNGGDADIETETSKGLGTFVIILMIGGGLTGLMVGANWLVDSSTVIARTFGVSEAVIGLTVVAVGTSLPELATSVIAAFRKQSDVAIGNIIGSNIFNIAGILGVTSIVIPVKISPEIAQFDIVILFAISVLLVATAYFLNSISRIVGFVFLVFYTSYVLYLF
ncbi:MAG: calcium/sodium antiporter [Salaquimonas sp.]